MVHDGTHPSSTPRGYQDPFGEGHKRIRSTPLLELAQPKPKSVLPLGFCKAWLFHASRIQQYPKWKSYQHADQFRLESLDTGENAALKVFQEVCARTLMLKMIVTDTTGRMRMMMGGPGPSVDCGDNVRQAVRELEAVVPNEHMVAGMDN
ncbi:uncharacterized protein EAF01_002180 [Botrytis porri]|uniref:uncharacterized protein n=1 Tax=Botrytis porri TaxID=87229 RepID=UPI001901ED14|nr:uncharacterized protein EAF01_002180 [Botrytis porri]KAF7910670.1 hypothetical protein EAF01_002180 [Botrytis porri]